jgi:nucleoside-diphosphate-sugar epimerase
LRRRRHPALPAALHGLAGDLAAPETLVGIPDGIELLAYTAAADRSDDDAYRHAYVDGVRGVLAALAERGTRLRRVLFTSSTAVYGQTDGGWVDETSPTEPPGFSGRRVLEGERLMLGCGVPAVILRLAGIYGPGRTRLIDRVRGGDAVVADRTTPRWTNRIHRDDCAGAAHHLLGRSDATGIWIGVDHEPAEEGAVLDWLAARLGVPPPRRAAEPATRGRPDTNKRCSNRKLLASGYRFRFPTFREGYAALLAAA